MDYSRDCLFKPSRPFLSKQRLQVGLELGSESQTFIIRVQCGPVSGVRYTEGEGEGFMDNVTLYHL